jgi:hypothetical protein
MAFLATVAAACVVRFAFPGTERVPTWDIQGRSQPEADIAWARWPVVDAVHGPYSWLRGMRIDGPDRSAFLGPFVVRWEQRGGHSGPTEQVSPQICMPEACDETALTLWRGGPGVFQHLYALRYGNEDQLFAVTFSDPHREAGVAAIFARVPHREPFDWLSVLPWICGGFAAVGLILTMISRRTSTAET